MTIHNPMRVVANREGSEFVFTLIRQPGMSNEQFAMDQAAVENDLKDAERPARAQVELSGDPSTTG